jgi:hypothetical protein
VSLTGQYRRRAPLLLHLVCTGWLPQSLRVRVCGRLLKCLTILPRPPPATWCDATVTLRARARELQPRCCSLSDAAWHFVPCVWHLQARCSNSINAVCDVKLNCVMPRSCTSGECARVFWLRLHHALQRWFVAFLLSARVGPRVRCAHVCHVVPCSAMEACTQSDAA